MSQKVLLSFLPVLLVASLFVFSCSGNGGHSKEEYTAIKAAMDAVEKNRRLIGTANEWKAVPMQGGYGILSPLDWAFWYKDGVVYIANGLAKSVAPKLKQAPVGIGFSEIKAAIK